MMSLKSVALKMLYQSLVAVIILIYDAFECVDNLNRKVACTSLILSKNTQRSRFGMDTKLEILGCKNSLIQENLNVSDTDKHFSNLQNESVSRSY